MVRRKEGRTCLNLAAALSNHKAPLDFHQPDVSCPAHSLDGPQPPSAHPSHSQAMTEHDLLQDEVARLTDLFSLAECLLDGYQSGLIPA
jgi:hypothetical protein